ILAIRDWRRGLCRYTCHHLPAWRFLQFGHEHSVGLDRRRRRRMGDLPIRAGRQQLVVGEDRISLRRLRIEELQFRPHSNYQQEYLLDRPHRARGPELAFLTCPSQSNENLKSPAAFRLLMYRGPISTNVASNTGQRGAYLLTAPWQVRFRAKPGFERN